MFIHWNNIILFLGIPVVLIVGLIMFRRKKHDENR
ncbi:LPXTG cell wall anchor domain-containing protein [Paenibacillus radicis (ex Xue et al. 2023)]